MKSQSKNCYVLGYGVALIPWLVKHILQQHAQQLPDLSKLVIITPHQHLQGSIRDALQKKRPQGILGPQISTLPRFIQQNTTLPLPVMRPQLRELELVGALQKHQHLFGDINPWAIAPEMMTLFDELQLEDIKLPQDQDKLVQDLLLQYQQQDRQAIKPALIQECNLIYLLWQAWQQQLQEEGQLDTSSAYKYALENYNNKDDYFFYIVAPKDLNQCERRWLQQHITHKQACLVLQGDATHYTPGDLEKLNQLLPEYPNSRLLHALEIDYETINKPSPYEDCLQEIFRLKPNHTADQHRGVLFAQQVPQNPLLERIQVNALASPEIEAHAVDQQIRRWKLLGLKKIAIVVEDRRLARRIRALLERWGMFPNDTVGWVLSTTSAASSIERWLQCIEEDYAYRALLDLLKLPFLHSDTTREDFLNIVYRFEQDVVLHENISRNIDRYREGLKRRSKRLGREKFTHQMEEQIIALLDKLALAGKPLQQVLHGFHPLAKYLQSLINSLQNLGLAEGLERDLAGQQLLALLDELNLGVTGNRSPVSWLEFRAWLGKCLESNYFLNPQKDQGVYLLSLEQTAALQFDGIIVAGADSDTFPGPGYNSPFFNNAVRIKLGLPSRYLLQHQRFHFFRRLLSSAERIFFTYSLENKGNPQLITPWLQLINNFIKSAYPEQNDLADPFFQQQGNIEHNEIRYDQGQTPPGTLHMPKPVIPVADVKSVISARAYQQLMNCPYAYFAEYILKLSPPEAIRLALQKTDYGEKVHTCLQAFHGGYHHIAPFSLPLSKQNREAAIDYLQKLSDKIFAKDIEDNFEHRSWREQWRNTIPAYIDWQIEHSKNWQVEKTEQKLNRKIRPELSIEGRVDRLDKDTAHQRLIVDYKTGTPPRQKDIENGEDVQLCFYGLLSDKPVEQAVYVQLKANEVNSRQAKKIPFTELVENNESRLVEIFQQMRQGKALPAWGDDSICRHCRWSDLCQRRVWSEEI